MLSEITPIPCLEPSLCVAFDTGATLPCVSHPARREWRPMSAANVHHHVWRLLIEHGVAAFGTNSLLVREPESYSHRTSAVGVLEW